MQLLSFPHIRGHLSVLKCIARFGNSVEGGGKHLSRPSTSVVSIRYLHVWLAADIYTFLYSISSDFAE